jgi:hypothetical protein
MAVMASPDMLRICFIGYAERGKNFGSSVDKGGLGQPRTKSGRPMDLGQREVTFRIGERITLTVTQIEVVTYTVGRAA